MATNQPQNLLEWQLHCVLQRANLLQYYDSFIRQGECNVLQLSESDDEKFKDVMEKVGMDKKSIHVRKDTHVPSNIRKADNFTTSPAPIGLEPGTVPLSLSEKSYTVKHVPNLKQKIQTKDKEGATNIRKKKDHQTRGTKQKHPQSDHEVKDEEHHGLTGYYDELLDNTVLDKMVLDNLISRCIIMIEDREEIIKPTTQRERNKVLLDILSERPYPTFQLFKDVLQESEPSNSYVQELVRKMMSTESRDEHISWQGHEIGK
ncbi:NAB [Mytilus edulis]|uniref:NAB n=1 Tax=Mytilus edulis TaxID=6550 RepID=A0A8S3TNA6_MYTED|nr:NAB [Mytilus edulis]